MIRFREIDDEYLEYDCLKDTAEFMFQLNDNNVDDTVLKELINQNFALFDYNRNKNKTTSRLAIKKESLVGKYLLSCQDESRVLNTSRYIDYDKIVNAFNISIFSNNLEMSKLIYPLFVNRVEGTSTDFSDSYNSETINYILANTSFKEYLKEIDEIKKESTYHVVYEDGKFFLKEFEHKNKSLVKSNNNL